MEDEKKDEHVNQNNARPGVYAEVIQKIGKDKICPFCAEHLTAIHPNPLEVHEYWTVTDNAYPYKPKKEHVLFIHNEHIGNISELSKGAWDELYMLIKEEKAKRNIAGGTFMLRFGDTHFTGASVTHLHAHLFQSDPEHEEYDKEKGVLTRVG
jgi:ATP adenylyltransferase